MNNVSERQLALMKHAIGWNYDNKPYRKRLKAYRNRYILNPSNDGFDLWLDLCEKKYAYGKVFDNGSTWFMVTIKGIKLLSSIYRVKIIQDLEDIIEV